jgi:rubrerythrin
MKVRPFVWPYVEQGLGSAYVGVRDWWLCPKCWQRFDFDRGGISSEYPPKRCPNCSAEWGKPDRLACRRRQRKQKGAS